MLGSRRWTTVTVYAPSHDGGGTIASGAFPLVIVSPGFQMPRQTQLYGVRWDFWN